MKNYFDFKLTGKKLLPVWLMYLLLVIAPYGLMIFMTQDIQPGEKPPMIIFPLLIAIMLSAFIIGFFIIKLSIEHFTYKENSVSFKGSVGKYIGTVLLGVFLSIITLGIYSPWFIRNLQRFFVDNSSLESNEFKFMGKGGKLFVILLLTLILPMIAVTTAMTMLFMKSSHPQSPWIIQVIMLVIMVPYIYYVYKWMVDVNYKNYHISWDTNFWNSCGKIAVEVLLSVITVGIYMPLAIVRLYEYFADKTVAKSSDNQLKFGYDIEQKDDFLFIWGQMLLAIITLGIYYPWAFCKIGSRVMSKTYVERN